MSDFSGLDFGDFTFSTENNNTTGAFDATNFFSTGNDNDGDGDASAHNDMTSSENKNTTDSKNDAWGSAFSLDDDSLGETTVVGRRAIMNNNNGKNGTDNNNTGNGGFFFRHDDDDAEDASHNTNSIKSNNDISPSLTTNSSSESGGCANSHATIMMRKGDSVIPAFEANNSNNNNITPHKSVSAPRSPQPTEPTEHHLLPAPRPQQRHPLLPPSAAASATAPTNGTDDVVDAVLETLSRNISETEGLLKASKGGKHNDDREDDLGLALHEDPTRRCQLLLERLDKSIEDLRTFASEMIEVTSSAILSLGPHPRLGAHVPSTVPLKSQMKSIEKSISRVT